MNHSAIWQKFVSELRRLNDLFAITRVNMFRLKKTIEFYQANTSSAPFWFDTEMQSSFSRKFRLLEKSINALNMAFDLSQTGKAMISESVDYPNDLDFVIDKTKVSSGEIDAAFFNRANLPKEGVTELGIPAVAILPVLVKGGAIVGGLFAVKGMVDAVSQSIVTQARINKQIEEIRAKTESELSKNPSVFAKWADYKKKTLEPQAQSFLSSLREGVARAAGVGIGTFATFGLIAIGGLLLYKYLEKRK